MSGTVVVRDVVQDEPVATAKPTQAKARPSYAPRTYAYQPPAAGLVLYLVGVLGLAAALGSLLLAVRRRTS